MSHTTLYQQYIWLPLIDLNECRADFIGNWRSEHITSIDIACATCVGTTEDVLRRIRCLVAPIVNTTCYQSVIITASSHNITLLMLAALNTTCKLYIITRNVISFITACLQIFNNINLSSQNDEMARWIDSNTVKLLVGNNNRLVTGWMAFALQCSNRK